MTALLLRLFVKDYKNSHSPAVRENCGKFAGTVGIVTNVLLFIAKLITGLLFGSISIMADAVNNLTDSASSFITLIGFKLSGKPADAEHPYGHARIEYITGLIVSFLTLMLGVELIGTSMEKILHPVKAYLGFAILIVLSLSILGKGWLFFFNRKIGKMIDSPSLAAVAIDSRNDMISTFLVLLGLLITYFTGFNLDGYMGLLVALLIVISGIKLIIETSNPILGTAPPRELVDHIIQKVLSYEGVLGIHDLVIHTYGAGRCFASIHCEVDANADIMISHDVVDVIEHDFLREENIHLVVHMDPVDTNDIRTMELRQNVYDKLVLIDPSITMHDFRVVWGVTHTNVIFDVCVAFDFSLKDEELYEKVKAALQSLDPTYNLVLTIDHDFVSGKKK